ncbi:MAG: LCP family protein [Actinobacteria bacterium]|nr:LCP family protein [Actinomycetota bacterium]
MRKLIAALVLSAIVAVGAPFVAPWNQTVASPIVIGRVHKDYQPTRGKIFVLVIGNDARAGNPNTARADGIHIIGVNTETMRGGILNFPRDSWVSIPGSGTGRINEALYQGGPKLLATTLESITRIHLDYWVMTGFKGFSAIIRALGGVKLNVQRDLYDPGGSGADIQSGVQSLDDHDSLAYVRTRHNFPQGDIDRTTNQGRFLLAMLRKLRREVTRSPAAVMRWMAVTRKHTRLDVAPSVLFRLGVLASQMSARDIGNVTVPVSTGTVGAASVVFIQPAARSIYARFREHGSL